MQKKKVWWLVVYSGWPGSRGGGVKYELEQGVMMIEEKIRVSG